MSRTDTLGAMIACGFWSEMPRFSPGNAHHFAAERCTSAFAGLQPVLEPKPDEPTIWKRLAASDEP